MIQLGLFAGVTPLAPAGASPCPPEPADPWLVTEGQHAGQLALFGDRSVRLGRARAALAEGRFDDASRELVEVSRRFPSEPWLAREAKRATKVEKSLAKALAMPPPARAERILGIARSIRAVEEPWLSARRALWRRVAVELETSAGPGGLLEGQPPGWYFLEAGAVDEAITSLQATVTHDPSAHALFLLGDAWVSRGRQGAARALYLQALVRDPFDGALSRASDPEVQTLPLVASDEVGIEAYPTAWSAPVGIVTGVLPAPIELSARAFGPSQSVLWNDEQQDALSRAREFVRILAQMPSLQAQHQDTVVSLRRTLKQLSPVLFSFYMRRRLGVRNP